MQMGTSGIMKRGMTALAATALLASSLFTLGGPTVSAQEGTAVAATAVAGGGTVDTSGCWTTPPTTTDGYPQWSQAPQMVIDPSDKYTATIETNKGDITVELYADKAPTTVNNFICLAGNGFYNMTLFHRILTGFVVQGGDPTATGTGGPGYQFGDELPTDLNYTAGTLAMANSGPNTNGSQFFICLDDLSDKLQKNYSIFGKVTGGMDVVEALAHTPVQANPVTGEPSVPTTRVGIVTITVSKQ